MKAQIKIIRKTLLAINTFASTDESRYVINGICIEVTKLGRCRFIATDGRRLGAIEDGELMSAHPAKTEQVVFILNEPLLKALPKSRNVFNDVLIDIDGSKIELSPGDGNTKTKIQLEAVEENFPKWRQVIPSGTQPMPIDPSFNWRLLNGFTKAADILTANNIAGIEVRQKPDGTMLILIPSVPIFVGVLMPMRRESKADTAPEWLNSEDAQ